MAAVSWFWSTNMAAETSYEDALLTLIRLLHVTILAFVDGTNNGLTTND